MTTRTHPDAELERPAVAPVRRFGPPGPEPLGPRSEIGLVEAQRVAALVAESGVDPLRLLAAIEGDDGGDGVVASIRSRSGNAPDGLVLHYLVGEQPRLVEDTLSRLVNPVDAEPA